MKYIEFDKKEMFEKVFALYKNKQNVNSLESNILCLQGKGEELLKNLGKNSIMVDAIITDPPYNISQENNFDTLNRAGIDFGDWDKDFDLIGWIEDGINILKPGGTIIIFSAWREMGKIADELERCGCQVKTLISWEKDNPMPRNTERLYVSDTEFAIWAVKNKGSWTFNKGTSAYKRPKYKSGIVSPKQRYGHKTAKSIPVLIDIINTHTNVGDLIVDPFSGTFTTMAACIKTNRFFIGTELNGKWLDVAKKRGDEIQKTGIVQNFE